MRATLVVVLLALTACDSGDAVTTDLPRLGADAEAAYQEDAAVLALRYQLEVARDSETVALPDGLKRSLYAALVRVRASEHGGLIEGIRTFPRYTVHDVLVGADTSATWSDGWRDGDATTGYGPIDQLVKTYDLRLTHYYDFPWAVTAVLRSEKPLNTVALGRRFAAVPGVRYAHPDGYGGDGDDITASREGRAWILEFSRGWGDCPAGCINREFWTFRVEGAEVSFLGSRGR